MHALTSQPIQSPVETVRIGILGAGFIAQVAHLDAYAELPDCRVTALADSRPELLRQVAGRHGVERRHDRPEALLADPNVDVVVVVLPRRAVGPATLAAVRTGRTVLAEKPFACTLAEGRAIVAAAEAAGSPLAVGYMKRHDAGVALFRDRLAALRASGEVGAIAHVAIRDYCATYAIPPPHHVRSREPRSYRYPVGDLAPAGLPECQHADYEYTLNVASHDLNLLRHLLGDALSAGAFSVRSGRMQVALLESTAYPVTLTLGRVDSGRWDQTIEIVFDKAVLRLHLPSALARQEAARIECVRGGAVVVEEAPVNARDWAFKAQARHVLEVARGTAAPIASGRDALVDLALIEELWMSAKWSRQ
jgi:predicted dehydrogenase